MTENADAEISPRPPRARPPLRPRVTRAAAIVGALGALVIGMVVGYLARGDGNPAEARTFQQTLSVVTITPGERNAP